MLVQPEPINASGVWTLATVSAHQIRCNLTCINTSDFDLAREQSRYNLKSGLSFPEEHMPVQLDRFLHWLDAHVQKDNDACRRTTQQYILA